MESTPETYFGMENGIPFISPWQNPLMAVMLQQDMLKSGYGLSEANELAANIVAAMQPRLIIDDDDDCLCCFDNNSLQHSYSKPSPPTQPRRKKKKAPQRNLKSLREAIREQKKLECGQSAETKVHNDVKDIADDVNISQQPEKKLKKTKNQGKSKTFKRQTKRPGRV